MAPNAGHNRRSTGSERRNYLLGTSSPAGNSDSAVPLLKFGTGNNWLKFKEKLSTACIEKYGDLARLMQTESYYIPPEIEGVRMEPYEGWQNDKVKEILYIAEFKMRVKAIRMMANDQSS